MTEENKCEVCGHVHKNADGTCSCGCAEGKKE